MKIYKIKLSTSDYGWTCLSRKAADDQMDELLNTALLHDEKIQDWLESLRIPEGFPVLTIGWPDEEHGITEDAWQSYCDDLAEDAAEDGIPFLPLTFEAWRERERENISEETEFSHHNCDLCGALPGARHNATAFKEDFSDYVPLEVCSECVLDRQRRCAKSFGRRVRCATRECFS